MSAAANGNDGSKRSVADVVADWRSKRARGEPVDAEALIADIEQATVDQALRPTISLQPRSSQRLQTPAAASHAGDGIADYEVLREIARGGMGVVYEARQRSLNRIVALKMIKPGQLDGEGVARFYAEAESAANLRHPNIVAVYEVGRADADGQHYFTMDYVAGPSLLELVRKQPLEARRAAEVVAKVARAIQFAHERGVLHRDLKPSNILIGEDGEPRVTDFGLAKRIDHDSQLTIAGAVVGTPNYMPPEQARGEHDQVGPRSDVYSLGAVLYECLTGRPPLVAARLADTLALVINEEPLPPSRLSPKVPHDLETICLKCLQKEPARRYATAGELTDDLERFLRHEPIRARPIGFVERAMKFARRKPAWAALGGVTMLATAIVIAMLITYTRQMIAKNLALTKAVTTANEQTALAGTRYESLRRSTYATHIQKTEDYWADDPPNLLQGEELLESLVPGKGETDLRGFEWFFLKRLCRPAEPLFAESLPIEALMVRDDGSLLVSDDRIGPIIAQYRDGKRIQAWKQEEGNKVDRFYFTRRGPWCAAVVGSRTIEQRKWESPFESGQVVATLPDTEFLTAISADGGRIAHVAGGDELKVWTAAEARQTHSTPAKIGGLCEIQFSPDGEWVLLRGTQTLMVVELATGMRLTYEPLRTRSSIAGATFSPDSQRVALTFADASVDLHDLRGGSNKPAQSFNLLKFSIHPSTIAFLPGGKKVALGSTNSLVVVVDLERRTPIVYRGHRAPAQHLDASPDGKVLYSGAQDGEVLAWDLSVEDQRAHVVREELPGQFPTTYNALAYSPDGRWLACGGEIIAMNADQSDTGRLLLVEVATRRIVQRLDSPRPIRACSFSPDSRKLIYGEASLLEPAEFYEFDVANQRPAGAVQLPDLPLHSAAYGLDGQLLLGCADGTLRSLSAGSTVPRAFVPRMPAANEHSPQVEELVASADGRMVFSKNFGHLIRLWDVARGEELLWSAGHTTQSAMAISARCDLAAWTTHVTSPRVVDARPIRSSPETQIAGGPAPHHRAILFDLGARKIRHVIAGHTRPVHALAISDDARRLASGDSGGILKLWDTETGSELLSMEGHLNGVRAIAFHPRGRQFATIGGDAVVRIWRGE
jgi:WD40 repeat protein/predicted Ser/Thr protein kinase